MTNKKQSPVDELLTAIEELGGTVSRSEVLGLLSKLGLSVTRRKPAQKGDE